MKQPDLFRPPRYYAIIKGLPDKHRLRVEGDDRGEVTNAAYFICDRAAIHLDFDLCEYDGRGIPTLISSHNEIKK